MRKVALTKLFSLLAAATLLCGALAVPAQTLASQPSHQITTAKYEGRFNKQAVHIKLRAGGDVSLSKGVFVGQPADQVAQLNNILSAAKRVKADHLLNQPAHSALQAQMSAGLKNYYKITFAKDIDINKIVTQLKQLSIVDTAYPDSLPPPPSSSSYVSLENYLQSSPKGVNASFSQSYPGGAGDKVKIIDIEYGWNTSHEDLSKARAALKPVGTPTIDDPNYATDWINHGTAVLGEMVADNNSYGVTGITPNAALELINVDSKEYGYNLPAALYTAAFTSQPGDVIVVEQQTWFSDINSPLVPAEWTPSVYDMIRYLTSNGRIVVEPAANGGQSLDDPMYGSSFPMGKADSGAIIVGAGLNCNGETTLSRYYLSNYGKRVNLQGPGDCVATTGYGDLNFSAGTNSWYTAYFAGTSSATPVVAATAAAVSSAYKTLNNGQAINPLTLRSVLMNTGTKQVINGTTYGGNVGPLPNLASAILYADQTPPTAPTSLTVTENTSHQAVLKWNASTDNVKVVGYLIFRNGALYQVAYTPSFTDTSVKVGSSYTYQLLAIDSSSHASAASNAATLTVR